MTGTNLQALQCSFITANHTLHHIMKNILLVTGTEELLLGFKSVGAP